MFQFCNILSYNTVRFALIPVKTVPIIPSWSNHFDVGDFNEIEMWCSAGEIRESLSHGLPVFQFIY